MNGNIISGQHINLKLTRSSSKASKTYECTSNYEGKFSLKINLAIGNYEVYCSYEGINDYESSYSNNSLTVY